MGQLSISPFPPFFFQYCRKCLRVKTRSLYLSSIQHWFKGDGCPIQIFPWKEMKYLHYMTWIVMLTTYISAKYYLFNCETIKNLLKFSICVFIVWCYFRICTYCRHITSWDGISNNRLGSAKVNNYSLVLLYQLAIFVVGRYYQ